MADDEAALSRNSPRFLLSLTSLRVFAALAVAIHHTGPAWAHTGFVQAFTRVGWLGVSYFFILSGFVLMWNYTPQTADRTFILRRIARIYPPHALCLLASLAFFAIFHAPLGGYVGTVPGTIANFLLIHDWLPGHPNVRQAWNGVSWTLSCEFFFYLTAPFLFRRLLNPATIKTQFCFIAALWATLLVLSAVALPMHWDQLTDLIAFHPVPHLVEFLLGASGAVMLRHGARFASTPLALLAMLLPITLYCFAFPEAGGLRSGAIMIQLFVPGAFLLIMAIAQAENAGRASWLAHPMLVFLGQASFALYLTHALFLGIFTTLRHHFFPISDSSHLWGEVMTAFYLVLALLLASGVHILVERPMYRLLLRKLSVAKARDSISQVERAAVSGTSS